MYTTNVCFGIGYGKCKLFFFNLVVLVYDLLQPFSLWDLLLKMCMYLYLQQPIPKSRLVKLLYIYLMTLNHVGIQYP